MFMKIPGSHENERSRLLDLFNHTQFQVTTDLLWLNNKSSTSRQLVSVKKMSDVTSQCKCQPSVQLTNPTLQIQNVYLKCKLITELRTH